LSNLSGQKRIREAKGGETLVISTQKATTTARPEGEVLRLAEPNHNKVAMQKMNCQSLNE